MPSQMPTQYQQPHAQQAQLNWMTQMASQFQMLGLGDQATGIPMMPTFGFTGFPGMPHVTVGMPQQPQPCQGAHQQVPMVQINVQPTILNQGPYFMPGYNIHNP